MSTREKKDIFSGLEKWNELNKDLNRPTPQGNFQLSSNNQAFQIQNNDVGSLKSPQQIGTGFRPHSPLDSKANLSKAGKQVLASNMDLEDQEISNMLQNFEIQAREIRKEVRKPKNDFYSNMRDMLKKEGEPLPSPNNPLKTFDSSNAADRGRDNAENSRERGILRSKSTKSGKSLEKKRPKGLDSLESFVENELKALGSKPSTNKDQPKTILLDSVQGDKKISFDSQSEKDKVHSKLEVSGQQNEGAIKDLAQTSLFSKMLGGQPKTVKAKQENEPAKNPKKKNFFDDEYDELAKILGITREQLTKKLENEEKQKEKEEKPAVEIQEEPIQGDEYDELAKLLDVTRAELLDILRASRGKQKFDHTDSGKKKKKKTLEEEYDELSDLLGIPRKDLKEKLKGRRKNKPEDLEHFFDSILNQDLPDEKKPDKKDRKNHLGELEELAVRLGTGSGPNYGGNNEPSSSEPTALKDKPEALKDKPEEPENQQKKPPKSGLGKNVGKPAKKTLEDDYDDLARILGIDREQLLKKLSDEEQQKKKLLLQEERTSENSKPAGDEYDELAELLGITRERLLELLRAAKKKQQPEKDKKKYKKKSLDDFYDDFAEILGIPKKELKSKIKNSKKKLPDDLELIFDKILSKSLPEEPKEKKDQKPAEDDYDELARILGVNREELTKNLDNKKTVENQNSVDGESLPHGDEYDELAETLEIPREDLLEILRGKFKFETPDPSKKKKKKSLEDDYEELAFILGIPKKDLKEKFKSRKKKLPWDLELFFEKILEHAPPEENANKNGKKDPIHDLEVIADKIRGNKVPDSLNTGDQIGSSQDANPKGKAEGGKNKKDGKNTKGKSKGKTDDKENKNAFDEDYEELANILGMDQDMLFKKLKNLEEDNKRDAQKKEQDALSSKEKERIIQEEKKKLQEEKRLLYEKIEEEERQRRQQNAEKYQKDRLEELEKLQARYHTEDGTSAPISLNFDHEELDEEQGRHEQRKKQPSQPLIEVKKKKRDVEMIPYINQHNQNLTNLDKFKRGLRGDYDLNDLPGGSGLALQDGQDNDFDPNSDQQGSSTDGGYGYRNGGNDSNRGSTSGSTDRGNYYIRGHRFRANRENDEDYIVELDAEEYGNEDENETGRDKRSRRQKFSNDSRQGKQGIRRKKDSSLDNSSEFTSDRGNTQSYFMNGSRPSSNERLLEGGDRSDNKKKHNKLIFEIAEVKDGKMEESSPVKSRYISKSKAKNGLAGNLTVDQVDTKSVNSEEGDEHTHHKDHYTHRREPFYLGDEFEIPMDQSSSKKMHEHGLDPEEWEEIEIVEEYEVEVTDETDEESDAYNDDLEEEKAEHVPILISQTPIKKKKTTKKKKTKQEKQLIKKTIEQKRRDKIEQFIDDFGFLEALARNTLQFDLSSQETRDEFGDKDVSVQNLMYRSYLALRRLGRFLTIIMNAILKPIDYEELVHPRAYVKAFKDRINIRITKNMAVLFAFFTLMMTIYCLAVADANDIARVRNDVKRSWVGNRLVPGAIIFTYYGIIFMEFKDHIKLWLLFILQCTPPGVILIVDIAEWYAAGKQNLPFNRMCNCIYAVVLYLFWWVTKLIKEDCAFAYTWKFSVVLSIIWFALVFVWIMGFAIYYSIMPIQYNFDWGYSYATFIAIPTMILTALTWVYWHMRFLNVPRKIQLMNKITDENKKKLFRDFSDNRISLLDRVNLIKEKAKVVYSQPEAKYMGEQKLEVLLKQLDEQDEREQAVVLQSKLKDSIIANMSTNATFSNIQELSYQGVKKDNPGLPNPQPADTNSSPSNAKRRKRKIGTRIANFVRTQYRGLKNQLILVSSLAMGGTLLLLMGLIIIFLLNVLSQSEMDNPAMFYLSVFFYFFTPVFLILGFLLVGWQTKQKLKNTLVPVLAAFLPMFVTMPLSNALVNSDMLSEIGTLLIFLPAMSVGFWLTLSYFFEKYRKFRTALVAFLFICFYIPLLVLRSMLDVNGFGDLKALGETVEYLLVGIGAFVVLLLFLYIIFRILIMDETEVQGRYGNEQYRIMTMFTWNIQNWGYWVNSLGLIISSAITLWSYFHASRMVSQPLRGFVLGLTLVYLETFYISHLALRLHVVRYRKDIKKTRLSFDDRLFTDQDTHSQRISNFIENNDLKEKQLQKIAENSQITRRLVVIHIGILTPLFIILLIAFSAAGLTQPLYVFLTLVIGTVVNMYLYHLYNEWKKYNPISARFVVPAIITYVWTAIICPLGALLPAANVFYGVYSEDYPKLERITVGTIALWILVTVSLLAIIANLFTKKLEFDRKVGFINNFMKRELDRIAVKSDNYILRKIYEDWINKGEKELSKMLKDHGKPAFWWPIPKTCHLTQYSKMLIDHDAYKKLRIRFKNKMEGKDSEDLDKDALDLTRKKYDANKKKWCKFCDGRACHNCGEYCFPTTDEWGDPIHDPNEKKPVDLEDEPLEFAPKLEEILAVDFNDFQKVDLSGNGLGDDDDPDVDEDDHDPEVYAEDASVMGHKIEIMGVDFWPLDPRVYRAMIVYCFAVKVHVNQDTKFNFLKLVFRLFAIGNWREYDERWLDFLGYKRLLELSGIIPSREFPDYMTDLIYSKYCYSQHGEKFEHINWPRFEGFVTEIAKVKFPNEHSDREALAKLIRYYMYPNLLHLLPSMHKGMPDEWRYMSYLINKYRKMAMRRRKLKALGFTKEEIDKIMQLSEEEIDTIIAKKEKEIADAKKKEQEARDGEISAVRENENFSLMMGDQKYADRATNRNKKPWSKCRKCMIALCKRTSSCWRAIKRGCFTLLKDIFFFNPNANKTSPVDQYLKDVHRQEEEDKAGEKFDEVMEQGRKDDDFAEDEDENNEERKKSIETSNVAKTAGGDGGMGAGASKKMKYKKKARKIYDHKSSPDWPVIVDVMMAAIQTGEREYSDIKDSLRNTPWKTTFSNIVALIIRIVAIYSMGSFGFSPSVTWNIPDTALAVIQSVDAYMGLGTYDSLYYACLVLAFFYLLLCSHALRDAKRGLLGTNKDGNRTRFPQLRFFQSQILNIMSQAFFIMMMKTFIAAYSCDFNASPYVLYTDPNMVCNSAKHKVFMGFAVVGMILYYPLASFLYPNLQIADEGDDLRYESAFVVIETQSKLFLAGFAVFFPDAGTITVTLSVALCANLGIAMLNKATIPCMIRVLVPWETGLYVAGAWLCACGIFVNQTGYNLIGWGLLIAGWIVIFILSAIGAAKVRRFLKKRQMLGNAVTSSKNQTTEKNQAKPEPQNSSNVQQSNNSEANMVDNSRLKTAQEVEMIKSEPKALNSSSDLHPKSIPNSGVRILNPEGRSQGHRLQDNSDPSHFLDILPSPKFDDTSVESHYNEDKKRNKKDVTHTARTKGNLIQIDEAVPHFDFEEFTKKQGTSRPY